MDEPFPIPDFRTIGGASIVQPSPNLRDTVYLCQLRQDWYREHALAQGERPLELVECASLADSVNAIAADIRTKLKIDLDDRASLPTWTEALRRLIRNTDEAGVLVMVSGVVGTDNRRKLDPAEFRGFALTDRLAPVVFVNGADTKIRRPLKCSH